MADLKTSGVELENYWLAPVKRFKGSLAPGAAQFWAQKSSPELNLQITDEEYRWNIKYTHIRFLFLMPEHIFTAALLQIFRKEW